MTSKLLLLATLAAALASASSLTITLSGTGSGTLGAKTFTSAHFTFTLATDTSLLVKPPCCPTSDTPSRTPAVIDNPGVGFANLTDTQAIFALPGESVIGLAHFNDGDMIDFVSPALAGYN